jgi:hypothetical protein
MLLLSTIDAKTNIVILSLYMALLGIGVGMLMQNLVLAAQNDVAAHDLGAATSGLTFFRSMGGAVGVSALGAVLADRIAAKFHEAFPSAPTSGGTTQVPDLKSLPPEVLAVVQKIYGEATADLFLVGAPFAVLALLTVVFLKEKPLSTLSGMDRAAKEDAEAAEAVPPVPMH